MSSRTYTSSFNTDDRIQCIFEVIYSQTFPRMQLAASDGNCLLAIRTHGNECDRSIDHFAYT